MVDPEPGRGIGHPRRRAMLMSGVLAHLKFHCARGFPGSGYLTKVAGGGFWAEGKRCAGFTNRYQWNRRGNGDRRDGMDRC